MTKASPTLSAARAALAVAVKKHGGVVKAARKVGTTEGTLRHAMKGPTKPRPALREQLEEVLGVAASSWDEAQASAASKPLDKPEPPAIPHVEETDDIRKITTDTLRTLRGLLQVADRDSMASIAQAISAQSRILARVSGQFEITQTQIVRSPHFREAMGVLERAIEPYPDAVRAAAKAFEELQR